MDNHTAFKPGEQLKRFLRDRSRDQLRLRPKVPFSSPSDLLAIAEFGASQLPIESHGPFSDEFGFPTTIDILSTANLAQIQRTGSSVPFLLFSQPPPLVGTVSNISLGPGTVWILASQFASLGTVSSGYIGLQITSGTITLSATSTALGVLTIPAASTADLFLQTQQSQPTGITANFKVTIPKEATFRFTATGGTLMGAQSAKLSVFGAEVTCTFLSQPASYDADTGRIQFPFHADIAAVSISKNPAADPLANWSGKAAIQSAYWSLKVDTSAQSSLGLADGAGGMGLRLDASLKAQAPIPKAGIEAGPLSLVVEPASLILFGHTGASAGSSAPDVVTFRDGYSVMIGLPPHFVWAYICAGDESQTWTVLTSYKANLDQPRSINNESTQLEGNTAAVQFQSSTTAPTMLTFLGLATDPYRSRVSYALKNLVLKADLPESVLFTGSVVAATTTVTGGTLSITSQLRYVVPILPDPYATNLDFSRQRLIDTGVIGSLLFQLKLEAGTTSSPLLSVTLPEGALTRIRIRPETYTESTGIDTQPDKSFPPLVNRLRQRGAHLLDLSTNVSQFGVAVNGRIGPQRTILDAPAISVSDLYLQVPNNFLSVTTLPSMQWEPLTDVASGKRLEYLDSGPLGVLATDNVALVPVAPKPAIDSLIESYQATPSSQAFVRFGLPFGVVAFAQLRRASSPFFRSPQLFQVQPKFNDLNLFGGEQISVRAARSIIGSPRESPSPSLLGYTRQFSVALTDGQNIGDSAIGMAVDGSATFNGMFNSTFGSATRAFVPVTRVDISGFGETIFSNWQDPKADPATISKASFRAVVGRCITEVVQAFSVILPYAIRVVRTITIERLNDGFIVRRDSGWQAASDGTYSMPPAYSSIHTHRGVVLAATDVANIREILGADQTLTLASGITMRPVMFDCSLSFDGAQAGRGRSGVPALNQMGYIQVAGDATTFGPAAYAELLREVGHLGGVVDCTIDIGGTGLGMQVVRVGVGWSQPLSGDIQFAMAAWGTVAFPRAGQWSFIRMDRSTGVSATVDPRLGVPLVRENAVPSTSPKPFRFADPKDLLLEDTEVDHGILFSTGYQRVLFLRPKIEADGTNNITSKLRPVIGDVYSLGTALGPFPRIETCIPFRDDIEYSLSILGDTNLRLSPSGKYEVGPLVRVLKQSSNATTISRIGKEATTDSHGNAVPAEKGTVTLSIDTAAPVPWTLNIEKTSYATSDDDDGELMRISGDLFSDASKPAPQLLNNSHAFGPAAGAAAKLLAFLSALGPLPKMDTSMTNDWELTVSCIVNKETLAHFYKPAVKEFIEKFCDDIEVKVLLLSSVPNEYINVELEVDFHIGSPQGPGFFVEVIAGGGFVSSNQSGNAYGAKLGFGLGYQTALGPFNAQAHLDVVGQFIKLPTGFEVGGFVRLQAEIDFIVVSAYASVEGGTRYRLTCEGTQTETKWHVWQLTVAVEVHIFWVVDIEFQHQMQDITNENGGLCDFGPEVL